MKNHHMALIALILFLLIIAIPGYSILISREKKKEECKVCATIALMAGREEMLFKPENGSIDTKNGGYWVFRLKNMEEIDERWENMRFSVEYNDTRTIDCSGNNKNVSFTSKTLGLSDGRGYYFCEANPGGARYDKDFGIDGKTNIIDSSFTIKHLDTLENITMVLVDEKDDGLLSEGDAIYIYRHYTLSPGYESIHLPCDLNFIFKCFDGTDDIVILQRDLTC